ncbi:MAG: ATP-binding protein [Planctomycetota bacterium]|nr:ATP-binding protein [Planctomycetota bacterium]
MDDDEDDYLILRGQLSDAGADAFHLDWTPEYDRALGSAVAGSYDVLLIDYRLGARTGFELFREATARGCQTPKILLTGQGDRAVDLEAMRLGFDDYLPKADLTPSVLDRTIRYAVERRRAVLEHAKIMEIAASREHLALLGEIAAGVAHEFRNPLHGVLNCVQILRSRIGNNPDLARWLDTQEEGLRRMDAIADRLLRLGRHELGPLLPSDMGKLIEDSLTLIRPRAEKEGISIRVERVVDLPAIPMDAQRVGEALLNLLTNALDACKRGDTVEVGILATPGEPGFATITVTDSGQGIAVDLQERLFEPFFTTKPIGKGSGLGLALVKRIAESHGGHVDLTSKAGQGTTVRMRLPLEVRLAPTNEARG